MTAAAIIVAAGSGQRFGNEGKAFALVNGMPMAWWSLTAANQAAPVSEIVLVCGTHSRAAAQSLLEQFDTDKPARLAIGGARRQDSALAGIAETSDGITIVAIHDAARPLVTCDLFDRSIEAAMEHGAAIVAIPVADTIKRVSGDTVQETVPRNDFVSVQTPQAFRKSLLLDAFAAAETSGSTVTDEAALMEASGHVVHVVQGRSDNIKVTYPTDLLLVDALLKARSQ